MEKPLKICAAVLFSLILFFNSFTYGSDETYDVVIKSGTIVDGTGNPGFVADIGIGGDKITVIGRIPEALGKCVIDARGLIVAPGFIDVHTHTDRRIDSHSNAENYLFQGVTTVVGGNCGGSRFPLKDLFRKLESNGMAINFATFVGHNTIRRQVMGNENRSPTDEELDRMKSFVRGEMQAGAIGLSTGLEYIPGRFSETEEIIELAKEIQPYRGVYATHLRDQGEYIEGAIEEAIRIGREAGVKVQIAHIKLKIEKSWGRRDMITGPITNAHREGIEVYMDEYPYTAGSTGFTSSFPEWAVTGGHETFVKRLEDPVLYKRIKDHIIDFRFVSSRGIDKSRMIYVTRDRKHPEYEGKNLAEILDMLGRDNTVSNVADLFIELERDDRPSAIFFQTDTADVIALMQEDYCMVGSDGSIQILGQGVTHPRNYGAFPKVLAEYVRESGALSLPDAIRKMSSLPAQAMGFHDRGVLKPGLFADIVIFNLNTVQDKATFRQPHQYPVGFQWVIVNGKIAVHDGEILENRAGRVLYGSGKK